MHFGFSYIGLIWLLMLFVPNFFWTKNKPRDYDRYAGGENRVLVALERGGEVLVCCLVLIFSDYNIQEYPCVLCGWGRLLSVDRKSVV